LVIYLIIEKEFEDRGISPPWDMNLSTLQLQFVYHLPKMEKVFERICGAQGHTSGRTNTNYGEESASPGMQTNQ